MDIENQNHGFEELLEYIRSNRGFDFTGYKRSTLQRRIQKRMQILSVNNYVKYQDYIENHPNEVIPLFDTIMINVTSFYRDEEAWQYLAQYIIPQILQFKDENEPIRAWSAGCATGQETYTLAMVLAEALGIETYCKRVKIYATDTDETVLDYARRARYNQKEIESVPEPYRSTYFVTENQDYCFHNQLRRSVIFGHHDLNDDAPISHLDLLVCRNTLM